LSDELRLAGAFALSLVVVLLATPIAIRIAVRTGFHDHPVGYKAHAAPTPYLGGAAVLAGFLAAATAFGDGLDRFAPILACALVLWVVGTVDDRRLLGPLLRILVVIGAALVLFAADLGWALFDSDVLNLGLTVVWMVCAVTAFNLMDNIDGAVSTVAGTSAAGFAVLAIMRHDEVLAALALSMSGACFGFLRYNLASPARIFLGDGGSMPIGFVTASAIMSTPVFGDVGRLPLGVVLAAVLFVGLPVLDTSLVMISRRRRGVPLLTGSVDHMTHRLRAKLPSVRALALVLLGGQAVLCGAAIAVLQVPRGVVYAATIGSLALWALAVTILEMAAWAPAGAKTVSSEQPAD
jgi:UDP-GlcNAc:undecaprenyl-phosphate/decaprenyl-phosphate GlcNAc-1-phosphate transferase